MIVDQKIPNSNILGLLETTNKTSPKKDEFINHLKLTRIDSQTNQESACSHHQLTS